jgi:RNA polymerase sigma factor (TIGR02999 family)
MQADPAARLQHTAESLLPLLYPELRRLAHHSRWRVSAGETLQTTALVHEAFLKLHGSDGFNDRQHFMRAAALAMRHILVNIARSAASAKHGALAIHLPLDDDADLPQMPEAAAQQLVEVDRALERLRDVSPRWADVVECRFFGGYSDEETAAALGLSDRTVRRDWLKARAWLRVVLADTEALP